MSELDHPTLAINKSLHRLPLILDILDEIETGTSHPGDEHLRLGSHEAVRCMVERLQNIKPHQKPEDNAPPTNEVKIASSWLLGERPRQLLPSYLYEELTALIKKLIPPNTQMLNSEAE